MINDTITFQKKINATFTFYSKWVEILVNSYIPISATH